MGNDERAELEWTEEERALTAASATYFQAIAACSEKGGRVSDAIVAAMPPELQGSAPMLTAMGML